MTTTEAHAAVLRHLASRCKLIGKTPTIPPWGPMPAGDTVGMSIAVDMLMGGLTGRPRIMAQQRIQFDSMCRDRGTFTSAWESLSRGIQEGSSISTEMEKTTLAKCPTQHTWFGLFPQWTEMQMGYATKVNKPFNQALSDCWR